jgi:KaiC/GvpD/RAD55 family RecA-like ATPase
MKLARSSPVAALRKSPSGVLGFDEITGGGLPRGRTTLLAGGPGCGKTIFALQFLVNGARDFAEPGIFVAFEESSRRIVANAESFGWRLSQLRRKKLLFVDAQPNPDQVQAGDFDLCGMLAGLAHQAKQMKARRIVFAERVAKEVAEVAGKLKLVTLDAQQAELQVRLTAVQTELVAKQVEKTLLASTTASRKAVTLRGSVRMRELRGGDAPRRE